MLELADGYQEQAPRRRIRLKWGNVEKKNLNRQRMLEKVNMEAWDTLIVNEVLVFCGGVNMARADTGDVSSRRAVRKERM